MFSSCHCAMSLLFSIALLESRVVSLCNKACGVMQKPFVDFMKSDMQARAMLIKASFDLFTVMQRRTIQVRHGCDACMRFSLLHVCVLQRLRFCAKLVQHIVTRFSSHICALCGQPCQKAQVLVRTSCHTCPSHNLKHPSTLHSALVAAREIKTSPMHKQACIGILNNGHLAEG